MSFSSLCLFAFKEFVEQKKMRTVLDKVVSKKIAEEILSGNDHLGGKEQEIAVLFADIRGFTQLTEKMPPKEVIDLLNQCMSKVSHVVEKNGGVIDKYVGDEAMALFGVPREDKHEAYQAVAAAIEMQKSLKVWNEIRRVSGQPPVEMGVGIHIGNMVAGNMGAEERLNYTVLGANVNLAARLCSAAGPSEILVTDAILKDEEVQRNISFEVLPPKHFKGFTDEMRVYRVKWGEKTLALCPQVQ